MNLSVQTAQLLLNWGNALLHRQLKDPQFPTLDGGILCPACERLHSRMGEMVYPFLRLARMTGEEKYLKAALHLRKWHQHLLTPHGAIRVKNDGAENISTLTGSIALAQSLRFHETLLDGATRRAWRKALQRNMLFLYDKIKPGELNPNNLAVAAHALALAGHVLAEPRFTRKAQGVVRDCLKALTPENHFLSQQMPLPVKTSFAVDLMETVCRTLPALVLYYQLTQDTEILPPLLKSLETHFQFLLPDGGWDNSWGTNLAGWTYWGNAEWSSSLPAFVLMASEIPAFTRFAMKHLNLLKNSTHDQFLYPGLHATPKNAAPCILSLCSQANSLATILDHGFPAAFLSADETVDTFSDATVQTFPEIQTRLVHKRPWRATFTSGNAENLHTGGGGLSLLWHDLSGLLLSASPLSAELTENKTTLTPRLAFELEGTLYRQIHDLNAQITEAVNGSALELVIYAKFLSKDRQDPPFGTASSKIVYQFTTEQFSITANVGRTIPLQNIRVYLPIISSGEKVSQSTPKSTEIEKSGVHVEICSNVTLNLPADPETRIFNPVPGLTAIPLVIDWPIKQTETLAINFRVIPDQEREKS